MPLPKVLPQVQGVQQAQQVQENAARVPSGQASVREGSAAGGKDVVVANRYGVEQKLGSGAFGTAFLVTDKRSNNDRKVLKQIAVSDLQPDETVDAVREARLLAKLDHPYIVKFHDSFMENQFFCIITEFCEGGDLDAKITQWRESGRSFEESLVVDWFIQLTTAVKYIHERRVLHRDLKARNIFLRNNLIKLGDFGISRILMGTNDMATTFTGTPYYMSPEVLKHDGYNSKSDVWSLGCVLYELCTLRHAFQGQNLMAVMYKIVEGEQPRLPDHLNSQLRALFLRMLDKDPRNRPSAVDILQEPFIQERLENLRGKMSSKAVVSSRSAAEEADAIAKALSPVKKKSLMKEERVLTPKQRVDLRKRQRADQEAERIRQAAALNFNEGRKRFTEHRKKQMRVVPPWVEEHPDVFSDPNFSITQIDTPPPPDTSPDLSFDSMGSEYGMRPIGQHKEEMVENNLAWENSKEQRSGRSGHGMEERGVDSGRAISGGVSGRSDGEERRLGRDVGDMDSGRGQSVATEGMRGEERGGHVDGEGMDEVLAAQTKVIRPRQNDREMDGVRELKFGNQEGHEKDRTASSDDNKLQLQEQANGRDQGFEHVANEEDSDGLSDDKRIPSDPMLAETFYSQYEDFESYSDDDQDEEYEALLECIEDALDLSKEKEAPVPDPSHDDLSPFSPTARERRIQLLRQESIKIYGEATFTKIYDYLHLARYHPSPVADERVIMAGLRQIVPNVRDCFLVEQLVFLEKQAESVAAMLKPEYSQR